MGNKEEIYAYNIDPYINVINSKERKKIFIDEKEIALSVGSHLDIKDNFKSTLIIDVYYDSNTSETLTSQISQLKNYSTVIALNPEFKDKKTIDKLRELDIISQTLNIVDYNNKKYELVEVNLDELRLYKPFGETILDSYRSYEKLRDNSNLNSKEL